MPSMTGTPLAAPALALVLVAAAAPAAAQEVTATLYGVVRDPKGAALPGVAVTLKNTRTGLTKDVVTGAKGAYTASFLSVGRYEVTFSSKGYATRTATDIDLRARDRRQLDTVLSPAVAKRPRSAKPRTRAPAEKDRPSG